MQDRTNSGSKGFTKIISAVCILLWIIFAVVFFFSRKSPTPTSGQGEFYVAPPCPTAALPSLTSEVEKAMQTQAFFCNRVFPFLSQTEKFQKDFHWVEKITTGAGTPFGMYVYSSHDFVSDSIRNRGAWERATEFPQKMDEKSSERGLAKEKSMFLDIGANIGYYPLIVASHGYTVIAVEPMQSNEIMFRSSMCKNPTLAKNIIFFNYGLGEKAQTCLTMSGDGNVGDGFTLCGENPKVPDGYKIRGSIEIKRLDDVLLGLDVNNILYAKIDTEGQEPNVLKGGRKTLLEGNITQNVEFFHSGKPEAFKLYTEYGWTIYNKGEVVDGVGKPGEPGIFDAIAKKNKEK